MIVKELELRNIRSYERASVSFPPGKTLFEGDIGSGKSTILMAIEFALFGLGSETGSSLLSLGAQEGGVRISVDVDGREFKVERGLERKGGRVQQTEGRLTTPEERVDLSPTELKERVLQVLEFNEAPDARAQSMIYRYAVYTPQEEMKEILSMEPDLRQQTLRRAFRVEEYKTAAENAEELARRLRGDMQKLDGLASGLEGKKEQLAQTAKEQGELERKLETLAKEESESRESVGRLRDERGRLRETELKLERLRAERKTEEKSRRDSLRREAELEKDIRGSEGRVSELEAALRAGDRGSGPVADVAQLRARERAMEDDVRKLTSMKARVEAKLNEYESVMVSGVCPVCDATVETSGFLKRKDAKEEEGRHVEEELARAEEALREAKSARERAERLEGEREAERARREEVTQLTARLEQKRSDLAACKLEAVESERRLGKLEAELAGLEHLSEEISANEERLAKEEEALRRLTGDIAGASMEAKMKAERRKELEVEVGEKERASSRRGALKEAEIWLNDYFVPTVGTIERSVLATINQEFDSLLRKWFSMLVTDPEKEVTVDDEFTPVVTQGGYEQDVRYLSGGERAGVALAYRLALNSLARKTSIGMKSNLLILDEPTDGFSQEQLANVREVLDDAGCSQVIIVSHDRELESFADQVYRVDKEGGRSRVHLAGA